MISFYDLSIPSIEDILFGHNQIWSIVGEDGNPIISFKSFLKAEYKSSGSVVFSPIENNSFVAYNKTTEPREYFFEVALQAPKDSFASAISKLEELKKGTELISFVTPFMGFYDLSLEGYSTVWQDFTSMMIIGLQCKEIIQVEQGYANVDVKDATPIGQGDAKNPDNSDTTDTGMTGTDNPSSEEESIYHKMRRKSQPPVGDTF